MDKYAQQRRYFTFYLDCNDCNYWNAVCCMEPVYSPELLSSAMALFLLFVLPPSALKLLSAVQSEWPPLEPQPRSEIIHLKAGLPAHADLTVQPYCCRLWNPTADVTHEKESFQLKWVDRSEERVLVKEGDKDSNHDSDISNWFSVQRNDTCISGNVFIHSSSSHSVFKTAWTGALFVLGQLFFYHKISCSAKLFTVKQVCIY